MKKIKKVIITGADGFIGKNLVTHLSEYENFKIYKFLRGDDISIFDEMLHQCDCVIHLAGENRPNDPKDFEKTNIVLTSDICNLIKKHRNEYGRIIKFIFTSSIQAQFDNAYGTTKKIGEDLIQEISKIYDIPVSIYRLPGIFGKWGRPNYNSVVATFCYNISRNLPIKLTNDNKILKLVYVDDLVKSIINECQVTSGGIKWVKVTPEYSLTLGNLASKIKAFESCRETLMIGAVGNGLDRALYSTYISYLPVNRFKYKLKQHRDKRGVFIEMLKTKESGQFSFFTAHPKVTRGGHYHHTKTEKFLVIKGRALFKFRHILTNEIVEIETCDMKAEIIDTIPGWAHDITNIGEDVLIVMLWANENFERDNPDTFIEKV